MAFLIAWTLACSITVLVQCQNLAVIWDSSVTTSCWSTEVIHALGWAGAGESIQVARICGSDGEGDMDRRLMSFVSSRVDFERFFLRHLTDSNAVEPTDGPRPETVSGRNSESGNLVSDFGCHRS